MEPRAISGRWWAPSLAAAVRRNRAFVLSPGLRTLDDVNRVFGRLPYVYDPAGGVRDLRQAMALQAGACADAVAAALAVVAVHGGPLLVCLEESSDGEAHLRAVAPGVVVDPYEDRWPGPRTCRASATAEALLRDLRA